MKKEEKYKCGHKGEPVLLKGESIRNFDLALSAYFNWVATTGYEGTKEECWKCYCNGLQSKKQQEKKS